MVVTGYWNKHLITTPVVKCMRYKGSCNCLLQWQLKRLLKVKDCYSKVFKTSVGLALSFQNLIRSDSEANKAILKIPHQEGYCSSLFVQTMLWWRSPCKELVSRLLVSGPHIHDASYTGTLLLFWLALGCERTRCLLFAHIICLWLIDKVTRRGISGQASGFCKFCGEWKSLLFDMSRYLSLISQGSLSL